ncbi:MAG: helix-turn-helix transcriptional regulator [Burkholderiaceae bacterium]
MRFRHASVADIAPCLTMLRNEGGWQAPEPLWGDLPVLIEFAMRQERLAAFQVFETEGRGGSEIVAFRIAAFVDRRFADSYFAAPHADWAARIWSLERDGRGVLLDRPAIAAGNARGDLQLVVLHWCVRHPNPLHPETARVLSMVPAAWAASIGGYRFSAIACYEVYGKIPAGVMRTFGYRCHNDSPGWQGREGDERPPFAFYWRASDPPQGLSGIFGSTFANAPPPRFLFSRAQQRLLLYALEGRSDRELAAELAISYDTVRQTWSGVFARIEQTDPALLVERQEADGKRGAEKRRRVIEYVRQHMEELRPFDSRVQ